MGGKGVDPHLGLGTVQLDIQDHRHRVAVDLLDVEHHAAHGTDEEPVAVDIDQGQLEVAHRTLEGAAVEAMFEALRYFRGDLADVADHQ